jgi:D-arabinitol dehydrogenase (NADP+)
MQALLYEHPRKIKYIELDKPLPKANEVVIQVAYSGICGTDLHIINGETPASSKVILGHEFSGTIYKTGKNVLNLKPGDKVAVNPNNFCNECNQCIKGHVHFCKNIKPIGVFKDGGWAQYCSVDIKQVYKLPDDLPLDLAALCEPISCILHGYEKVQPLFSNGNILIIGAGLIGLLWGILFKKYGLLNFVLSEPNLKRRNICQNLEFETVVPQNISNYINKKNNGFDLVVDCSGNPEAIDQAIQYLNPMGKLLLFGICPQNSTININPFQVFQKELTIFGSVINPHTFPKSIDLIKTMNISLEEIGVKFFSLIEYKIALESAKSGINTKVIFKINEE